MYVRSGMGTFLAALTTAIGFFVMAVSAGWIKEVLYISATDEFYRRHHAAADFAGAIWNFGVYGEAALRMWDESQEKLAFEYDPFLDLLDVCIGFDYLIPILEIDTRVEYYHQGSGERDKSNYDFDKQTTGEWFWPKTIC